MANTGTLLTAVQVVSLTFSGARIQIHSIYGSNDCLPPQRAGASRPRAGASLFEGLRSKV